MSATETVTIGRALPRLATVAPANGPFSVAVTWAKGARVGRTDIVDLAPMIFTFKAFRALRDNPTLFRSVFVGEWGAALAWEGNADLEIGADAVEEMAEEVMTNSDFAAFLARHGLTLDAAAAQLGISRRLVAYFAKNREIPRYIMLACRALDMVAQTSASAEDTPLLSEGPYETGISTYKPDSDQWRELNVHGLSKFVGACDAPVEPYLGLLGTNLYVRHVPAKAGAGPVFITSTGSPVVRPFPGGAFGAFLGSTHPAKRGGRS